MEADKPAALKEIFDRGRLARFADEMRAIWPDFDRDAFMVIATRDLDTLGIMQRMRRTAEAFDATLPPGFDRGVDLLRSLAPTIGHGFASIALSEFVVIRGRAHFDRAMEALAFFTRFGSAEFAIRTFLLDDLERTLAVMRRWAENPDEHVRRLASEGARPRLPWSFQLRALVADPRPALPILDALKADDSPYVRKSVANHLNDIGKDHPDILVDTLAGWPLDDRRTGWIARHALRTMIKAGEPRALSLVGAGGEAEARIEGFSVTPALRLGERLAISADVVSTAGATQRLVADYAIHYVRKSGRASRKVFKLKTFDLPPGARARLSIGQTVRDFTTRSHCAGFHAVELMLNGKVVASGGFDLSL